MLRKVASPDILCSGSLRSSPTNELLCRWPQRKRGLRFVLFLEQASGTRVWTCMGRSRLCLDLFPQAAWTTTAILAPSWDSRNCILYSGFLPLSFFLSISFIPCQNCIQTWLGRGRGGERVRRRKMKDESNRWPFTGMPTVCWYVLYVLTSGRNNHLWLSAKESYFVLANLWEEAL